ncbi:MAG: DUF2812 domain-containing protein [Aminipila sp.]
MNKQIIKRLWRFEDKDIYLIESYLNDMSAKGYALEYIETFFATYKRTNVKEYVYGIDYNMDGQKDAEEIIKTKWIQQGWEYIDKCNDIMIFKSLRKDGCSKPYVDANKIDEYRYTKIKALAKSQAINFVLFSFVTLTNFLTDSSAKYIWAYIMIIQLLDMGTLFNYKFFNKNIYRFRDCTNSEQIAIKVKRLNYISIIKLSIKAMFFIYLPIITMFYCRYYFLTKIILLFLIVFLCYIVNNIVKKRHKVKNSLRWERNLGRFIIITIGMIIIIGVTLLFAAIDSQIPYVPKDAPNLALNYKDSTKYLYYDYGSWEYSTSYGSSGHEYEFRRAELNEIKSIDIGENELVQLSFPSVDEIEKPEILEARYWSKDEFTKIKSYDDSYQEIVLESNTFKPLHEDVVYAVYAKWNETDYKGEVYYLFTIANNNKEEE